jgi:hypothetical protein
MGWDFVGTIAILGGRISRQKIMVSPIVHSPTPFPAEPYIRRDETERALGLVAEGVVAVVQVWGSRWGGEESDVDGGGAAVWGDGAVGAGVLWVDGGAGWEVYYGTNRVDGAFV